MLLTAGRLIKYDLKELYGVEYQIDDDVMLKSCDEH